MAPHPDNGAQPTAAGKPRLVFEYNAKQGSMTWRVENGLPPLPQLVNALEIAKASFVDMQIAQMVEAQAREQAKKITPAGGPLPPGGLDGLRPRG